MVPINPLGISLALCAPSACLLRARPEAILWTKEKVGEGSALAKS
jgi:hypothetical protein